MTNTAFSNDLFLQSVSKQLEAIIADRKVDRMYIQIGGRLLGDQHAARVLPGYDPDIKAHLVERLKTEAEFVYCISQTDLDRDRIRGDNGLVYTDEVIRSMNELAESGITLSTVVLVGSTDSRIPKKLKQYLADNNIRLVLWAATDNIFSEDFALEDFGTNDRVTFDKKFVVVLSPGSNSGKFEFCLQQLYLDGLAGMQSSYIRLHIFPLFELHPLHPINLAFFAASADVYDHSDLRRLHSIPDPAKAWQFYTKEVVIRKILDKIYNKTAAINMHNELSIMNGITSLEIASEHARAELYRRLARYQKEAKEGKERPEVAVFVQQLIKIIEGEQ